MLLKHFVIIFIKREILQVINAEGIEPFKILTKNKSKWGWNSFSIDFLNK